jgi:antitoxin (DNA-binding transcriptional repressor) of toxin-antitoxin stability system
MITLSITNARKNLGSWVKKAASGEQVAILVGNHVVALRPVEVVPKDYAEREYELSQEEVRSVATNLLKKAKADRKEGRSRSFTGDIEALL